MPTNTTVSATPANANAARTTAAAQARAELTRKNPSSAQLRLRNGSRRDPLGQVLGLFGSLLRDPNLHPALLGAGLVQASRFTNSTAPAARTIAA